MNSNLLTDFTIDKVNNKINVERKFVAPLTNVWDAWTKSELLDQWWAPRPWQAKTKTMNFSEGGAWLYAMMGPAGEAIWAKYDYRIIKLMDYFTAKDSFTDENGVVNEEFLGSDWKNSFKENGDHTVVNIELTFVNTDALEKILEMGFKEGFISALENLDEIFAK